MSIFFDSYRSMLDSPSQGSTQESPSTHEQPAALLTAQVPNLFDPDLVLAYRPIYATADFLSVVGSPAPFLIKYILYKILLPEDLFLISRISSTYPPAIAHQLIRSLGL